MLFPQEFHIFDILVYFIHTTKNNSPNVIANISVMSFRLPISLHPIIMVLKTRYTDHSTEHNISLFLSTIKHTECFSTQFQDRVSEKQHL